MLEDTPYTAQTLETEDQSAVANYFDFGLAGLSVSVPFFFFFFAVAVSPVSWATAVEVTSGRAIKAAAAEPRSRFFKNPRRLPSTCDKAFSIDFVGSFAICGDLLIVRRIVDVWMHQLRSPELLYRLPPEKPKIALPAKGILTNLSLRPSNFYTPSKMPEKDPRCPYLALASELPADPEA
jgi:hypothetical protein